MTRTFLAAALAVCTLPAAANEFPFGGNNGPLARSFALPPLGAWDIAPPGQPVSGVSWEVANEYVREGDCAVECIALDGETRRLRTDYRVALGRGWDISVHVPYVDRGGGFLDGWIEEWHGWFGLPNGGRELAPKDRFEYRYERANVPQLDERDGAEGLGDVSVGVGVAFGAGALRGLVKLPTGDGALLSGDNTGGAVWLDLPLPVPRTWGGYVSGGYSRNERGEVLAALQNEEVWFGGIGLLVPVTQRTRLSLQLNGHTRLYDGSALSPLAREGLPLTAGLQFAVGQGGVLDIGFQEDPSVNGSPDFVAYIALGNAPARPRRGN